MESRAAQRRNGMSFHLHCRSQAYGSLPEFAIVLTRLNIEYKNKGGLKADDLRRRREEQQVEIRRQKREENISKRRNFLPSPAADSDDEGGATGFDSPVRVNLLRIQHLHILNLIHV